MLDLWQSILLGTVQGLGEFLPISSSAHLVIFPWLFNFKTPGLSFDVALHFGTLLSLLGYFFRDWLRLTKAFFTSLTKKPTHYDPQERLIWFIILATIPAGIVGLSVEEYAETIFRNPLWIGINMALFGILLYWADRRGKKQKEMSAIGFWDAMIIGLVQCLALIPGTSRSGVTITAGLMRQLDRTTAARFSFLLSTPAVLGAAILKLPDFLELGIDRNSLIGIAVSAVVGYLAIKYMLLLLRKYSYAGYVVYRLLFALLIFLGFYWKS